MILLDKTTDTTLWDNVKGVYADDPSADLGWKDVVLTKTNTDNINGVMTEFYEAVGVETEYTAGSIFEGKTGYFLGLAVDVTDLVAGAESSEIDIQVSGNEGIYHGDALDDGDEGKKYVTALFEMPYKHRQVFIKITVKGEAFEYAVDVQRISFDGVAMYDGFVYDGKTYAQGETIWDLGKWACTEVHPDGRRDYMGNEVKAKLPPYAAYGSSATNPATSEAYSMTKDGWIKY